MQVSMIGFLVCAGVMLAGYYSGSILIVGIMASLAFGSTALVTLTSLGGSSPLIYTVFAALLVVAVATRRSLWTDLGYVFGSIRPIWVLGCVMLYAIIGAWLFPRLFAGQTTAFVQSRTRQGIIESALAPVSSNITQTGYFVLGGLTAIALCVLLLRDEDRLKQVRRGFFLWCFLHAAMGMLDLMGKLAGAGDVLAPIRTANYAWLTEVSESGFWRIAGANSEASAFGAVSLACLAFTYTYWRRTKSLFAGWLSVVLLLLTLLSTSSTAYVGLAILSVPAAISIAGSIASGRLELGEILMLALLGTGIFAALAFSLHDPSVFDPLFDLIDATIVNKESSASGQERLYWNTKSLQAFSDTSGLGIGFGSSRASSWLIAILSQLGLVGAVMMATLLAVIVRGMGSLRDWVDPETDAVVSSVRACALASVVAGSLMAGSADPGIVFFIALAVISTSRVHAYRNSAADDDASSPQLLTKAIDPKGEFQAG